MAPQAMADVNAMPPAMQHMMRLLKDPLFHFLGLGLALFLAYGLLNPVDGGGHETKRIVVNRDALLTFIQYRTQTFQPDVAKARLDAMPKDDLAKLVDDYVREEALFREAKAYGFADTDYDIKQRMIEKMEFVNQGAGAAALVIKDDDIEAYFKANQDSYREPGYITFAHVFFSAKDRGMDAAVKLAAEKLAELKDLGAGFTDAAKHGERFEFGVNYVERSEEYLTEHFGPEMTKTLFGIEASDRTWHGPLQSKRGAHLVIVLQNQPPQVPALETIRARVASDLASDRQAAQLQKEIQKIVDTYAVEIDLPSLEQTDG